MMFSRPSRRPRGRVLNENGQGLAVLLAALAVLLLVCLRVGGGA